MGIGHRACDISIDARTTYDLDVARRVLVHDTPLTGTADTGHTLLYAYAVEVQVRRSLSLSI